MKVLFGRGKLLLTGEYSVLHGAEALVLPVAFGQFMRYCKSADEHLHWVAKDQNGEVWFEAKFDKHLHILSHSDEMMARNLCRLLKKAKKLSQKEIEPLRIETKLNFDRHWGMGTSSTLFYLVSKLFEVDVVELFRCCEEKGSGYDLLAAGKRNAFIYANQPVIKAEEVELPDALLETHFVYLNRKQNSSTEVRRYLKKEKDETTVNRISAIAREILQVKSENELTELFKEHEALTAAMLEAQPISKELFPDFSGTIKSLGAWGGDFIWVIGTDCRAYFRDKGYHTIFKFGEMVS